MAMTRKGIIGVFLAFLLVLPCNLLAADLPAKESGSGSADKPSSDRDIVKGANALINSLKKPDGAPEWLKRTTIKFQIQDDYKPTYELETVQPIFQTYDKDMFFIQLNARSRSDDQTYNLGIGYRNIVVDWLMLGVNSFYDYATPYDHQRYGFGLEALGKKYEARANTYFRASNTKEISTGIYQRVMNGYDVEIGGSVIPVKALEDLKIYAGYQWFDAKYTDDLKTYQLRVTYPITQYTSIELKAMKDENKAERYYAQLTVGLDMPASVKTKRTKDGKDIDLKQKLLQPVERVKDIVVEQYAKAGGFTVKVKRGN
ncbi:MAG: inverse autotransporter beta domain-containing protein [Nitrospirota bacterium]|nr:inverse autotransporter beta domain-containing protein [Nitrospirota bacterium]